MIKKILIAVCAAAFSLSSIGCDDSPGPGDASTSDTDTDTDTDTTGMTGDTETCLVIEPRVSKAGPLMLDLLDAAGKGKSLDPVALDRIFEAHKASDPVTFGLISGAGEPGDIVELQGCAGQVCVSCSATFAVHISCKLTSPIGNCVGGCGIYGCAITCA